MKKTLLALFATTALAACDNPRLLAALDLTEDICRGLLASEENASDLSDEIRQRCAPFLAAVDASEPVGEVAEE